MEMVKDSLDNSLTNDRGVFANKRTAVLHRSECRTNFNKMSGYNKSIIKEHVEDIKVIKLIALRHFYTLSGLIFASSHVFWFYLKLYYSIVFISQTPASDDQIKISD